MTDRGIGMKDRHRDWYKGTTVVRVNDGGGWNMVLVKGMEKRGLDLRCRGKKIITMYSWELGGPRWRKRRERKLET